MCVIRRYVRQVAERFKPDKIILFGSFADGSSHEDSDVDLLVIMPC
jgi:predicted nucleotidyltransferase